MLTDQGNTEINQLWEKYSKGFLEERVGRFGNTGLNMGSSGANTEYRAIRVSYGEYGAIRVSYAGIYGREHGAIRLSVDTVSHG